MMNAAAAVAIRDRRRFERISCAVSVHYRYAPNGAGLASCYDVSPRGVCIRLARNLRAGTYLLLRFDASAENGTWVEAKGQIVWCRPPSDYRAFVAGVRVFDDEPDGALAFRSLVSSAREGETGDIVEGQDWRDYHGNLYAGA